MFFSECYRLYLTTNHQKMKHVVAAIVVVVAVVIPVIVADVDVVAVVVFVAVVEAMSS